MSDLTGNIIAGRYRLDEFRGRGGMADVYKAWDTERAAVLAMKVLHEDLAEDQVFLRRFRREAQTLAKLKHPNIVRFYELGQDGELVFMMMEYVDGMTLSKARNRWRTVLTAAQILTIIQPVCSALHYAHQLELIHCDIKPGNIMIDWAGHILLADFGIARVSEGATTATMVGAGTPAYMSPEQIVGEDPSPQTDIYSLGVVLYELFTGGERPFTGEQATITGTVGEKVRWEKRNLQPPSPRVHNPSLSPELDQVILCCLQKDRDKRYKNVDDLLNGLTRAVGVPPESLPTAVISRDEKRLQEALRPDLLPDPVPALQPVSAPPAPLLAAIPESKPSRRGFWIAGGTFMVLGLGALMLGLGALMYLRGGGGPFPGSPTGSAYRPAPAQVVQPPPSTTIPALSPPTLPPPTEIPTPVSPDVTLTKEHDSGGYYLVVHGGPEDYDIRYGPISDGAFVLADNQKFAAYVDINGIVYIMNFHTSNPRTLMKFGRKDLQALAANDTPNYSLTFRVDNTNTYTLIIQENDYGDILNVSIPRTLSE